MPTDKEVVMPQLEAALLPLLLATLFGVANLMVAREICIRIERVFVWRTMILIILLEATCALNFFTLFASWICWVVAGNDLP